MNHTEPALASLPFVLVTGGKGGVGKTTLVASLGVELARRGARVLLVDLDLALSNLHVMFGRSPRFTLEDHLERDRPIEDCIVDVAPGRRDGYVDLLPAGSGRAELARPDDDRRDALLDSLAELAPRYDVILGDSAAGIGDDVITFAGLADRVLVVTTPEPAALTDAYGLVKAVDSDGRSSGREIATPELVLNLVSGADQASRLGSRLRGVCERFLTRSPRMAGWLPRSTGILRSSHLQRPFAQTGRDTLELRCLRSLSRRLEAALDLVPAQVHG